MVVVTFDNKVKEPITFKFRSFRNQEGNEVWNFGDGTPTVAVKLDGNVDQQAADGYAIIHTSHLRATGRLHRERETQPRRWCHRYHATVRVSGREQDTVTPC